MRTRTCTTTGFQLILISLSWAAFGGPAPADHGKPFSHQTHKEQGANCTDCHAPAKNPPAVQESACASCHEEGKIPPFARGPQGASKSVFSHPRHLDKVPCDRCHHPDKQGRMIPRAGVPDQPACFVCHASRSVKVPVKDCSRCHPGKMASTRPASHGLAWAKHHGMESEQSKDLHGRDCQTCHEQSACRACHLSHRPQSHTGLWRLRTHGISARWDRGDSCRNCHETGACQGCHRATKPVNHQGNWKTFHALAAGGSSSTSCLVCHRRADCAACHGAR